MAQNLSKFDHSSFMKGTKPMIHVLYYNMSGLQLESYDDYTPILDTLTHKTWSSCINISIQISYMCGVETIL